MSETEHYIGKLKPTGKTIEDYMRGIAVPDYYSSTLDYFQDEMYEEVIEIKGYVYEIEYELLDPYDDIYKATLCEDGTIDFEVKYYNGGGGLSEALEDAVKMIKL